MSKPLTEEQKEKARIRSRKWYSEHRDEKLEYQNEYNADHKEEITEYKREYDKEYYSTLHGRAVRLLSSYNRHDGRAGRGQGGLTVEQVVELIQQPCAHCRSSRMGDNWPQ